MKLKQTIISTFAKLILGSKLFDDAKSLAHNIQNSDLTGAEKRAAVRLDLLSIFGTISDVLINLSIELAVLWLKENNFKLS